jgi:hypothetical protein
LNFAVVVLVVQEAVAILEVVLLGEIQLLEPHYYRATELVRPDNIRRLLAGVLL